MKKNYKKIIVVLTLLILLSGLTAFFVYKKTNTGMYTSGNYTFIDGTVSAYDPSPAFADGGIIFKINNESVDIGGGLRPQIVMGGVYEPIRIGDKVSAKLIHSEGGTLTVYGCSDCYVKKRI